MDANSKPVILARWIKDEDGRTFLENQSMRVRLDSSFLDDVYALYTQANGSKTVHELCTSDRFQETLGFLRQLEQIGLCFESTSLTMYGHRAGNFPDVFRPDLTQDEVFKLQQLDQDPGGIKLPASKNADSVRKTCREFNGSSICWSDLETILLSAYGITGSADSFMRRTVPSAGAMFPLQHDIFVLKSDIPNAHYRWAKHENSLIRVGQSNEKSLKTVFFEDAWIEAAVVHVIGFDITRSAAKYSSRAHRFAILEAGHSAQNAINTATNRGIGSWEYGGYDDEKLEAICGLDSPTSGIATVLFYGGQQ
ncbi:MAG: nitroreductase family protein [Candidatus Saccharibacteria bacterium]